MEFGFDIHTWRRILDKNLKIWKKHFGHEDLLTFKWLNHPNTLLMDIGVIFGVDIGTLPKAQKA